MMTLSQTKSRKNMTDIFRVPIKSDRHMFLFLQEETHLNDRSKNLKGKNLYSSGEKFNNQGPKTLVTKLLPYMVAILSSQFQKGISCDHIEFS